MAELPGCSKGTRKNKRMGSEEMWAEECILGPWTEEVRKRQTFAKRTDGAMKTDKGANLFKWAGGNKLTGGKEPETRDLRGYRHKKLTINLGGWDFPSGGRRQHKDFGAPMNEPRGMKKI